MFEKDIENAFTAKVAKYLADGYIFNLATMNGSQGEYGKVDLCKGDDVVRILLEKRYEGNFEIYALIVGRSNGTPLNIIWNNKLKEIERTDFYVIKGTRKGFCFGTKEDAEMAGQKQVERYRRSRDVDCELPDAYREIAYRILKKSKGLKSIKKSDIIKVRQEISFCQNHPGWYNKRIVADISRNGRTSSIILYAARH